MSDRLLIINLMNSGNPLILILKAPLVLVQGQGHLNRCRGSHSIRSFDRDQDEAETVEIQLQMKRLNVEEARWDRKTLLCDFFLCRSLND